MRVAEDLYMNGYISYPRTDNTVYPSTLDIGGILKALAGTELEEDVHWVSTHRRPVPTRGKKSSTDHPPIHPASAATRQSLGEERWKIYELVVRRFLATLSPDARWKTMKVNFEAGKESYTATGGQLIEAGWRKVYPYSTATDYILPAMKVGERLPVKEVNLEEKETRTRYMVTFPHRNFVPRLPSGVMAAQNVYVFFKELTERIIETLQRSRPEIVHIFDEVVRVLPEGVYLTYLKQSGTRFEIRGVAQSSTRVSAFMRNIDASEWLADPALQIVVSEGRDGGGASFTLFANQRSRVPPEEAASAETVAAK